MSDETGKSDESGTPATGANRTIGAEEDVAAGANSPTEALVPAERRDLPKWNRARVKRKQVKGEEQDAFQGTVRKAGRQAIARAPLVIGVILVSAALVAGMFWYRDTRVERRAEATRMLAEAVAYRHRGQVTDVAALTKDRKRPFPVPIGNDEAELRAVVDRGLTELASDAPDSDPQLLARLVRASQAMQAGAFDDAETGYAEFLSEAGPEHKLAFLAREGLALAKEGNGDIEGALAELEVLIGKVGDFYRDQGLYQKARLLQAGGRTDEARAVYEQYVAEYPLDKASIPQAQVIEALRDVAPELVPVAPERPGLDPALLQGLGQ